MTVHCSGCMCDFGLEACSCCHAAIPTFCAHPNRTTCNTRKAHLAPWVLPRSCWSPAYRSGCSCRNTATPHQLHTRPPHNVQHPTSGSPFTKLPASLHPPLALLGAARVPPDPSGFCSRQGAAGAAAPRSFPAAAAARWLFRCAPTSWETRPQLFART